MTQQLKTYTFSRDDPDLLKKAEAFFLEAYDAARNDLLERQCRPKPQIDESKGLTFSIGLDNLPRAVLPEANFIHLLNLHASVERRLSEIPDENPTPYEAGRWNSRRRTLLVVRDFCRLTLYPLLFDARYHPERRINAFVSNLFEISRFSPNHFSNLIEAHALAAFATKMRSGADIQLDYAEVFQLLQLSSRIFFNTTIAGYGLPEIIACSSAFDAILLKYYKAPIEAELAIYRQKWAAMYEAIRRFEDKGNIIDVEAVSQAHKTDEIQKVNEKLDILLQRSDKSAPKKPTRKRYLCSNDRAARHFGVSTQTIERWRAYYRDREAKNAVRPPAEFPQGYDVTPEEMKRAGKKYRGLID